jgi:hypothetical protein
VFVNIRYDDAAEEDPNGGCYWARRGIDSTDTAGLAKYTIYLFMTAPDNAPRTKIDQTWRVCFKKLAHEAWESLYKGCDVAFTVVGDEVPAGRSAISDFEREFLIAHFTYCNSRSPAPGGGSPRPDPDSVKFTTYDEMRKLVGGEMFELIMNPEL